MILRCSLAASRKYEMRVYMYILNSAKDLNICLDEGSDLKST